MKDRVNFGMVGQLQSISQWSNTSYHRERRKKLLSKFLIPSKSQGMLSIGLYLNINQSPPPVAYHFYACGLVSSFSAGLELDDTSAFQCIPLWPSSSCPLLQQRNLQLYKEYVVLVVGHRPLHKE